MFISIGNDSLIISRNASCECVSFEMAKYISLEFKEVHELVLEDNPLCAYYDNL